ncbi:MAG: GTP-binding protein, partial [Kiritimatiellaeota bacterium]|nr:GTP-binding protein [Kiritimatiellota bacterium]
MAKNSSKAYGLNEIRNVGIIAHIDAGKTTTTERFLYYSGKTHRIGEVDNGNTVMDYLDEERERGITIVAASASFPWTSDGNSQLIHLIDTPGHIDFTAEVERSLRVCDGAVVIFSAVEGVEAQSEKVWRQSSKYKLPKIAFINKLDRMGASYARVRAEMQEKFNDVTICPIQMPVGEESTLEGIVDLIDGNFLWFEGDDGSDVRSEDIPDDLKNDFEVAREEMLAILADYSDIIAEAYLEERAIDSETLVREIRGLAIQGDIVPLFAGSAKKNIGIQPLLDGIVRYLPNPEERGVVQAVNPSSGAVEEIGIDDSDFTGLVFKVLAGGSADLLYIRSYSGVLRLNDKLLNPRTGEKIKVKRLLRLYSKNVEPVDEIGAGDIAGVIGPAGVATGDTLCSPSHPLLLESITFPDPIISIAVEPKSSKDKDRLDEVLRILCREDPTLQAVTHETTGQRLLSGMGELHLEINCDRLRNEFKIEAKFGMQQVAFRETLLNPAKVRGEFKKTIADQEVWAEVEIELEPAPKLPEGLAVSSELPKNLPLEWRESASSTLLNGMKTGGNWGYPLIYIKALITELKGDSTKTTDAAVAGAVLDALHAALGHGTKLLEPLVRLEILAPENVIGEITGYIQARRAVIHGIDDAGPSKKLLCEVPLAEMFGFGTALPKLSGGRASFSMEP